MTGEFIPADQDQRDKIISALDETLFVEAGAGTGKTEALVLRITNLITSGRAKVADIAAITFTEAAAAELRDRIRQKLEEVISKAKSSSTEYERSYEAARGLENSSIRTLHSFAGALLHELPLEAGLPPNFDTVEAIEATISFEERFQQWLEVILTDETTSRDLQKVLNLGLQIENLRTVAKSFHENYDLLPDHFSLEKEPPKRSAAMVINAVNEIRELLPLAHNGLEDPLAGHANLVAELGDRLKNLGAGSEAATMILAKRTKLSCGSGTQKNWSINPGSSVNGCKEMKWILQELEGVRSQELELVRRASFMPILESLRCFVLDYTEERRRSGKVEFQDLLIWARDLLRDNLESRTFFQNNFKYILIDEFQDTDPIQAQIAFLLAGESRTPTDEPDDWTGLVIKPGKLFVVGDPKQSIYRFRRADITTVEQVRSLMEGDIVTLSQNFRSQDPVISWVNSIFTEWMGEGIPGIQAPYIDLVARWKSAKAEPKLGVHYFGGPTVGYAAEIRRQEAEAVTGVLQDIRAVPWMVRDENGAELRESRFQDVCILMPTRTGLQTLERALEMNNIPYRIESQSLVLGTQDVRELLSCLRSIDMPVDQVALVASLRSSAFGCSDIELLQFVEDGGKLDYINPGTANGPVREALAVLNKYHQERIWTPLDELIERFIRERQMTEVCFGRPRPRERLRRLRLVVERARAFARVEERSLRSFLDWIEKQADEGARMVETPVPETDADAVRIMTIHAAKGLEFPIVILTGLGHSPRHTSGLVAFDRATHSVAVRIGPTNQPSFTTGGFEEIQAREKLAEVEEGVRLMYVATTRAKDHLVLSLYHPEKSIDSPAAIINRFGSEYPDLWREIDLYSTKAIPGASTETEDQKADTQADREAWMNTRKELLQRAGKPASTSVTAIASIEKDEAEKGETYYRRGRGSTNLGRAVHSVLQSVDLVTQSNLEEISKAQAAAEGIPSLWKEVIDLTKKGIETVVVKRALSSGNYYREVFVSVAVGDGLVEGFIDLLFEENGGLVIVDYKTDTLNDESDLPEAQGKYELQGGAYAFAVEEATKKPVKEVVLIFLRSGKELKVFDIDIHKAEARDRAVSVLSKID